jgi:hypothetical protein
MSDTFVMIGYAGAILYAITAVWHAIRYRKGHNLFRDRIDVYLNFIGLLLLLVYSVGVINIPLIIFFSGIVISMIIGYFKPSKRRI